LLEKIWEQLAVVEDDGKMLGSVEEMLDQV
jgi:hypothetical protein